jgi:hypothetical protein
MAFTNRTATRNAQPPESRPRPATRTGEPTQYKRSHYLLVGLALAGLWLLSGGKSLLFHAVQMLVVMSLLTGLQIVLRRRAGQVVPYVRLTIPKLALVGLAVGSGWVLSLVTSSSNAIVAAGLVVLVTAAGPRLDRVAANRARSARGAEPVASSTSNGHEPIAHATFDITETRED